VDDEIKRTFRPKKRFKAPSVSDIQAFVAEVTRATAKSLEVPAGVPFGPKEVCAHIVVNTNDDLRTRIEESHHFGTD
jgi:hypothetical protein